MVLLKLEYCAWMSNLLNFTVASGFEIVTCYTVVAMLTVTMRPPAKVLIEYLIIVHLFF
jgi:hypothetical protein